MLASEAWLRVSTYAEGELRAEVLATVVACCGSSRAK